jgi:hypothetical protein
LTNLVALIRYEPISLPRPADSFEKMTVFATEHLILRLKGVTDGDFGSLSRPSSQSAPPFQSLLCPHSEPFSLETPNPTQPSSHRTTWRAVVEMPVESAAAVKAKLARPPRPQLHPAPLCPCPRRTTTGGKGQTVWTLNPASEDGASQGGVSTGSNTLTRQQQLEEILNNDAPLTSKCGVHERGTCCKDLKGDDERHLISPEIVRDV